MGGHLEELLQLSSLFEKYDYLIVCEKSKASLFLKNRYQSKVKYLLYGTIDHLLKYLFILPFNFILSLLFFKV